MTNKPLKEHDIVVLLHDLPQQGLEAGDAGTIVHCYDKVDAYEVEFHDVAGKPRGVFALEGSRLLKLNMNFALAH